VIAVSQGERRAASGNGKDRASPPEELTDAAKRFFETHAEIHGFVAFVYGLAKRSDEVAKVATEALHDTAHDPEEKARLGKELDDIREGRRKGALAAYGRYTRLIVELVVTRVADNYLTYLAELLALIFTTRPETLKSNETVRVDEILKHPSMEELIAEIAERRVVDLSHEDMENLAKYLEDRLGFRLFDDSGELRRAVRIVKARNLIVHNRGVVNRTYKTRVPEDPTPFGQRLDFSGEDVIENGDFLAKSVVHVDRRAIEKFGLPAAKWSPGSGIKAPDTR
jgi:hypothetical protein